MKGEKKGGEKQMVMTGAQKDVLGSHLKSVIEMLKSLLGNIEKEDCIDGRHVDKTVVEAETELKKLRHSVYA